MKDVFIAVSSDNLTEQEETALVKLDGYVFENKKALYEAIKSVLYSGGKKIEMKIGYASDFAKFLNDDVYKFRSEQVSDFCHLDYVYFSVVLENEDL